MSSGWHRYEALGFEGCCDGGVGFQARRPTGPWRDLSTANFDLRGVQCIVPQASLTIGAAETCSTELIANKQVEVDATSTSPYSVPGSIVRYDLSITNPGQSVDAATIVLTDAFPNNVNLMTATADAFTLVDGTYPSGLSLSYGGPADTADGVEFSTDGTNFNYVPSTPVDGTVTHVRFRPTGSLNPNDGGDRPSFTIRLFGQIP